MIPLHPAVHCCSDCSAASGTTWLVHFQRCRQNVPQRHLHNRSAACRSHMLKAGSSSSAAVVMIVGGWVGGIQPACMKHLQQPFQGRVGFGSAAELSISDDDSQCLSLLLQITTRPRSARLVPQQSPLPQRDRAQHQPATGPSEATTSMPLMTARCHVHLQHIKTLKTLTPTARSAPEVCRPRHLEQ